jgi:predicted anti-sigma-YlaC factor YlaD
MSAGHGRGEPGCREIFARLSEYLDGELDPESCTHLDEHMGDCPPCRAFLESLRHTVELARDLPGEKLPEDLIRALLESYRTLPR